MEVVTGTGALISAAVRGAALRAVLTASRPLPQRTGSPYSTPRPCVPT